MAPGCRVTDIPFWGPATAPEGALEVERIYGVPYRDDAQADELRHRLDLFLPKGKKDYPVVVLVHGGAWMSGDNRSCGLYSAVGEFLASRGIGAVLPNYRLSPTCKHPDHIHDLAKAFAWTRAHIGAYGGNPDQMVLVGHSAGGHLVALLATDESYLAAEDVPTSAIKGVVAISGVYHIPNVAQEYTLGGSGEYAFHLKQMIPIRGSVDDSQPLCQLPGIPLKLNVFAPVFGYDPLTREDASPVFHVRPDLPPFLLFSASEDLPSLPGMAREFHRKLLDAGCSSQLITVAERNHNTIMFRALTEADPVGGAMLEFIQHVTTGVVIP
jgi:acetyl esterase/lipase